MVGSFMGSIFGEPILPSFGQCPTPQHCWSGSRLFPFSPAPALAVRPLIASCPVCFRLLAGHGDYAYQQSSYSEQSYDRSFEEPTQHYYEGGEAHRGGVGSVPQLRHHLASTGHAQSRGRALWGHTDFWKWEVRLCLGPKPLVHSGNGRVGHVGATGSRLCPVTRPCVQATLKCQIHQETKGEADGASLWVNGFNRNLHSGTGPGQLQTAEINSTPPLLRRELAV